MGGIGVAVGCVGWMCAGVDAGCKGGWMRV